eukprot:752720-Hanusia_phi.AAC.2
MAKQGVWHGAVGRRRCPGKVVLLHHNQLMLVAAQATPSLTEEGDKEKSNLIEKEDVGDSVSSLLVDHYVLRKFMMFSCDISCRRLTQGTVRKGRWLCKERLFMSVLSVRLEQMSWFEKTLVFIQIPVKLSLPCPPT